MTPWWRFTWDLARETKRLSAEVARLRDSYTRLSDAYYDKATALEREEQRAADMALVASEPCLRCDQFEVELVDVARERDEYQEACLFMERIGFGATRAEGEAS